MKRNCFLDDNICRRKIKSRGATEKSYSHFAVVSNLIRANRRRFDCVKPNSPLCRWVSTFGKRGIQAQYARQCLPMICGGANLAVFPLPHRPCRNPGFCGHFRLCKVGFDALQQQAVTQSFWIDWNELSGAKSAVRKLTNDTDCPPCNSQQRAQPPMCDSVWREALGLPRVSSAVAQLLSVRRH